MQSPSSSFSSSSSPTTFTIRRSTGNAALWFGSPRKFTKEEVQRLLDEKENLEDRVAMAKEAEKEVVRLEEEVRRLEDERDRQLNSFFMLDEAEREILKLKQEIASLKDGQSQHPQMAEVEKCNKRLEAEVQKLTVQVVALSRDRDAARATAMREAEEKMRLLEERKVLLDQEELLKMDNQRVLVEITTGVAENEKLVVELEGVVERLGIQIQERAVLIREELGESYCKTASLECCNPQKEVDTHCSKAKVNGKAEEDAGLGGDVGGGVMGEKSAGLSFWWSSIGGVPVVSALLMPAALSLLTSAVLFVVFNRNARLPMIL